jgi:hypothetical protein
LSSTLSHSALARQAAGKTKARETPPKEPEHSGD